ncbi:MAG: modification methylase, partial [Spirochaetaceae bacterium]|nr:modification methylase [Spirochaetaceae bacterium]
MKYQIKRNKSYDYSGQSYSSIYPNLHKYPATMLPQLGIDILKEFNVTQGNLLDPYCGSGSSFICGLECGLRNMSGFDINPLAILISNVKYTKLSTEKIDTVKQIFRNNVFEFLKDEKRIYSLGKPEITNIDFWFSKETISKLSIIKYFIEQICDKKIKNFFLLPFSETVRECSYTRNNEFKLYRMKESDILNFNPDVISVYFKYFNDIYSVYKNYYLPKLDESVRIDLRNDIFKAKQNYYDIILTSPPYGDSRTTVAYGQFSTLSNEWLGINYARKIDSMLMGGAKLKTNISKGIIADYISDIDKIDKKRALEVSSFYNDLDISIQNVAASISKGGKSIYIVGNRTVKNLQLPTDQFIAEKFEQNGFKHIITYERALSNKAMPSRNSPTNKAG